MSVPDSVMETLQKLANMSVERGCTPAEAALAASHLERLLEKWQLSKFDIKTKKYSEGIGERKGTKIKSRSGASAWVLALAGACAFPHDCRYYFTTLPRPYNEVTITFVGHESDVQVAQYLFDTLTRLLTEMGKRDGTALGKRNSQLRTFLRQYLHSAAVEVHQRLQAERDRIRQEQVTSRALVVVKEGAVREWMQAKYPSMRTDKKSRNAQNVDWEAVMLGTRAGRSVEIKRGIGQQGGGGPAIPHKPALPLE